MTAGKGERLKELREHYGLSQNDFAETIDVTQPHLSSMERGKRQLSSSIIDSIANCYSEVNIDWLIHGRGDMVSGDCADLVHSTPNSRHLSPKSVTYLAAEDGYEGYSEGSVKKGFAYVIADVQGGYGLPGGTKEEIASYITLPGLEGPGLVVQMRGHSMQPVLEDKDYLATGPQITDWSQIKSDYIYLISTRESGNYIKYVRIVEQGLQLLSANAEEYSPIVITFEELAGLWEVKARLTQHLPLYSEEPPLTLRLTKIEQYLSKQSPTWRDETAQ